ncbi:MAG TPA: catalase family peroxidase [Gemmatimonadaceae bacterium]
MSMRGPLFLIVGASVIVSVACRQRTRESAGSVDDSVSPVVVVNALEGAYGVHPGLRRNHAKGTCATGTFVGLPVASTYSRSGLFSGQQIPVVARFSISGGDTNVVDAARVVRGMALQFQLPKGTLHHMTMINTPMFFGAVPRTFLDKMVALRIDPATGKPNPAAIKAFAASHPDNTAQTQFLATHAPPPSYANAAYYGVHTFKFVNQRNETTLVRFRFEPQDGLKALTPAESASLPRDFLEQALVDRTKRGPAQWDMLLTIGGPGDAQTDPTVLWPKNRREVKAGTLSISSAARAAGDACVHINYDPLVLSDGVVPTSDPILLFRSPSYAVSYARRQQGK